MPYKNGKIQVSTKPGLGVELDRDKLRQYAENYQEYGGYPYDRDPGRKGWFSLVPNTRWADPTVSIEGRPIGLKGTMSMISIFAQTPRQVW